MGSAVPEAAFTAPLIKDPLPVLSYFLVSPLQRQRQKPERAGQESETEGKVTGVERPGSHADNMVGDTDEEDGTFTNISLADESVDSGTATLHSKKEDEYFAMNCDMDGDVENQVELEEKTRLINQVLELQHTLEDLSARVDAVKEENLKLKSENQVLGQYIENLMSASSVFQTTDTKSKRNCTGLLWNGKDCFQAAGKPSGRTA
ncbi:hypothetical protein MATL_G00225040 [Megalops atlanticus]|uniref:Short coiled-coil protein n=1 Tax=Megalops atlanticus TaxID=7932 RepID=A0A9D3PF86_MEGAT|nr:hypothetical protein MATL_G00225040 [Megalops atlanticus]